MKRKFIGLILVLFFFSGCALFSRPASMHEGFVYTYEDAGFHLQLAKMVITSLHTSGDLTGERFEQVKSIYNKAVEIFQAAGEAYKAFLLAPDQSAALRARDNYRALMMELTKIILEINAKIKGGK